MLAYPGAILATLCPWLPFRRVQVARGAGVTGWTVSSQQPGIHGVVLGFREALLCSLVTVAPVRPWHSPSMSPSSDLYILQSVCVCV